MQQTQTIILGAGLSGLSAAYHLAGQDFLVIEKKSFPGGLCTTEHTQGFLFDQTGHWLHMRNERVKQFVDALLGADSIEITRRSYVFSHNTYTPYPFQSNTFGLPPEVIKECVLGFIRARYESDTSRAEQNFYEWCRAYLGEGISKHFMIPYNSKLYTVHPQEFASHWCETYIPVPTLEQVIEGALLPPQQNSAGYNATFIYPRIGGIGELTARLYSVCEQGRFFFDACPAAIDMQRRVLSLHDGEQIQFANLISTIPLPDFLQLLRCDAADRLHAAAQRMKSVAVSYYNAAFKTEPTHPGHWFYIPEQRYRPYRVGWYSNIYPPLAPAGCSSAYIEYTHQGPLADEPSLRRDSKQLFKDMRLISSDDDILFMEYRLIENGYVVFHREYAEDNAMIAQWCRDNGVVLAGRYGRWVYAAMEDAIADGMQAAREVRCAETT